MGAREHPMGAREHPTDSPYALLTTTAASDDDDAAASAAFLACESVAVLLQDMRVCTLAAALRPYLLRTQSSSVHCRKV